MLVEEDFAKLKPCPFCGGPANYTAYGTDKHQIDCANDCNQSEDNTCLVCVGTPTLHTKETAFLAWNTRAHVPGEIGHVITIKEGEVAEAFSEVVGEDAAVANARLIAAAPELLEALLVALPFVEDCEREEMYKPGVVKKHVKQMRALIEKATGGA
jgi:hypothetical protein